MTNARQEANRQIAEARESAQRAETVGAILAAPDLVRINLTGGARRTIVRATVVEPDARPGAQRIAPPAGPSTDDISAVAVDEWGAGQRGLFVP